MKRSKGTLTSFFFGFWASLAWAQNPSSECIELGQLDGPGIAALITKIKANPATNFEAVLTKNNSPIPGFANQAFVHGTSDFSKTSQQLTRFSVVNRKLKDGSIRESLVLTSLDSDALWIFDPCKSMPLRGKLKTCENPYSAELEVLNPDPPLSASDYAKTLPPRAEINTCKDLYSYLKDAHRNSPPPQPFCISLDDVRYPQMIGLVARLKAGEISNPYVYLDLSLQRERTWSTDWVSFESRGDLGLFSDDDEVLMRLEHRSVGAEKDTLVFASVDNPGFEIVATPVGHETLDHSFKFILYKGGIDSRRKEYCESHADLANRPKQASRLQVQQAPERAPGEISKADQARLHALLEQRVQIMRALEPSDYCTSAQADFEARNAQYFREKDAFVSRIRILYDAANMFRRGIPDELLSYISTYTKPKAQSAEVQGLTTEQFAFKRKYLMEKIRPQLEKMRETWTTINCREGATVRKESIGAVNLDTRPCKGVIGAEPADFHQYVSWTPESAPGAASLEICNRAPHPGKNTPTELCLSVPLFGEPQAQNLRFEVWDAPPRGAIEATALKNNFMPSTPLLELAPEDQIVCQRRPLDKVTEHLYKVVPTHDSGIPSVLVPLINSAPSHKY